MRTWEIIDHLCHKCNGRILQCVTGNGMTPGGNLVKQCASCGESTTNAIGSYDGICWCSVTSLVAPFERVHRCVTVARAHELDPDSHFIYQGHAHGEVMTVLIDDYNRAIRSKHGINT